MRKVLLNLILLLPLCAMAQERVLEGIDSTVVYTRNDAGQMEMESIAVYQRNEAGQVVSKTSSQFGSPHEYIEFRYEDFNGDGTIDEVQEYSYWYEDHWDKNVTKVSLNFGTNMKHDIIDLAWDCENNKWTPSAETVINLSDEGKTAEVVKYWQDWETKALVPFQKQYVKMLTSIFDKLAADPETSIEMILHRHVQDYTLSERYEYNEETKGWVVNESRTREYDENGDLIKEESHYYQTYPTVEMFAGERTIITKTEDGFREDNYFYNNGEWLPDNNIVTVIAGNRLTRTMYQYPSGSPVLYRYETQTLDEKGRMTEFTNFKVNDGKIGDPDMRYTYEYDDEANKITEKRYNTFDGEWALTAFNIDVFDQAGRTLYNEYAQSYDRADKGWDYGSKFTAQYTADGKVITTTSYNLNKEASTIDEIVWELREKYCNFFHHNDAEAASTDGVTVTPSESTAQFTWPIVPDAYTYSLYIYLHGSLFHHYVFDSQGRLLGINYAPGKDRATPARYAAETANGWQFVILDLAQGTEYAYTFIAEAENGTELKNIAGSFKTPDTTGIEAATQNSNLKPQNFHNLAGQKVDAQYKGIVVKNGRKFLKR